MSLAVPVGVRRAWSRLRLLGGVLVLGALVWRFGTGPFADAWHVTTWTAVAAALAINVASTLSSAWRWRVVARELGAPLTVRESLTAYYRSQVINSVLPGGIVGDAHRGVRHGRSAGDVTVGLRATAWERMAGQAVQIGLLVLVLGFLETSLRFLTPLALLLAGGLVGVAWVLARSRGAAVAWVGGDLRTLLRPPVAGRIALASGGSSAGHIAVFLLAAHVAGVQASLPLMITAALVVLVGSAVPLNVAGWGPREGLTAWVFAYAGLGGATGLTVSIVYGVLGAVATAPGLLVLLGDAMRREPRPDRSGRSVETQGRLLEEAPRG